jgi:GNAT superfamily N-acetyltransferase
MTPAPFDVRDATARDLRPLRHCMLRQGMPPDAAIFEGDDEPHTLHAAAWGEGAVVGCGSLVRRPLDGVHPAYQLRGMAVATDWQQRGVGAAVLRHLEARAVAAGFHLLWCNARTPAVPFYERQGWRVISDEFLVPTAGPHFKMRKDR